MKQISLDLMMCCIVGMLSTQSLHQLSVSSNWYRTADQLTKQQVDYKDPAPSGK